MPLLFRFLELMMQRLGKKCALKYNVFIIPFHPTHCIQEVSCGPKGREEKAYCGQVLPKSRAGNQLPRSLFSKIDDKVDERGERKKGDLTN